jgi:hypothetical protein
MFANPANGRSAKLEFFSDVLQKRPFRSHAPHLFDVCFVDFRGPRFRSLLVAYSTQFAERMLLIFRGSAIFKIFQSVVRALSVLMVPLMDRRGLRADESCKYKQADGKLLFGFVSVERYSGIASRSNFKFTQTANFDFPSVRPTANSFDVAKVADFIKPFVSYNWAPSFMHFENLSHSVDNFG